MIMDCCCLTLLTFATFCPVNLLKQCKGPLESFNYHCGKYQSTMDYIFLPNCLLNNIDSPETFDHDVDNTSDHLQSVSWILAEFYFNRGLQRLYTGTCIILQKTINGFLCLLIVFLKSKTYQLILKDVIKLNRNLR